MNGGVGELKRKGLIIMAARVELAKGELERIRNEQTEISKQIRRERDLIPFGQPNIIGRRDIYKEINQKHAKSIQLVAEEEKQTRK